jgi:hypothetical protein
MTTDNAAASIMRRASYAANARKTCLPRRKHVTKEDLNSTGILRVPAWQVGETCRVFAFRPFWYSIQSLP